MEQLQVVKTIENNVNYNIKEGKMADTSGEILKRIEQKVAKIGQEVNETKVDVAKIGQEINETKVDVANIRQEINETKVDVAKIGQEVKRLPNIEQKGINNGEDLAKLNGKFNMLFKLLIILTPVVITASSFIYKLTSSSP